MVSNSNMERNFIMESYLNYLWSITVFFFIVKTWMITILCSTTTLYLDYIITMCGENHRYSSSSIMKSMETVKISIIRK